MKKIILTIVLSLSIITSQAGVCQNIRDFAAATKEFVKSACMIGCVYMAYDLYRYIQTTASVLITYKTPGDSGDSN